ncbi:AAA family ATPase [Balneola sp. MJW-20]|uniref:AAA family ATPase n=1 Tax=Gracilimonas aurantiaca TaxID=3234185 RepID=UPI0034660598
MKRIVLFGNSGSGKSTLAKEYASEFKLAHLDLDTLAWEDTTPPERRAFKSSAKEIDAFQADHSEWVIEGCYAGLLEYAMRKATEIIFLNPGVKTCVSNARSRPWESHKYPSKKAQDDNLSMLLEWIKKYPLRDDEFSLRAHRILYEGFEGKKKEYTSNLR